MASVSCLLCQRGCVHCRGAAAFQHVASIIDNCSTTYTRATLTLSQAVKVAREFHEDSALCEAEAMEDGEKALADNYHDEAGQWYETWEDLAALAALGA